MSDGRAIPLRFGLGNSVADATLTADPVPVVETPLDWLKTERRAQRVQWSGLTRDVVIRGTWPELQVTQFVALPNTTLVGFDEIRLTLYTDDSYTEIAYTTGFQLLAEPVPIGVWVAGIDPFGAVSDADRPEVFVHWLPQPIIHRSFELTIRPADYAVSGAFSMRSIMLGRMLQVERNFEYGGELRQLTTPSLTRAASGFAYPSRRQRRARTLALSLPMMSDSDRAAIGRMERDLLGQPFLVSAHAGRKGWQNTDYSFLARFDDTLPLVHDAEDIHATALQLVEV